MKIDSDDKEISEILGSGYYQIPRFQRPYSWEAEHITEFWNDTIVDSDADYFIGSMVVFSKKNLEDLIKRLIILEPNLTKTCTRRGTASFFRCIPRIERRGSSLP